MTISPKETPEVNAPASPPPASPSINSSRNRRAKMYGFTLIIVVIGIAWALIWFLYWQYYESTDDSYVKGNLVNVTSVIEGAPIAFYADDTDLVEEGQVLVVLDSTDHQINYEKQKADLASTVLQVRQLYHTVKENQVNLENKRTLLSRALYDYENRQKLISSKAITNEDFTHSRDDLTLAELNLKIAEYQLQIALDAAGNTSIENHPLIEVQKANVRNAFYNLKHCTIYAPTTGYVAQRNVEVGQWVKQTTPMMAIIPINYMWVDANFKETQLTYMRIGQRAWVTFDIYGGSEVFDGVVLGIASGTGSVFSLIPPQNATGNWIKIVQRLPVRISIDPEKMKKFPLRLGLSTNVSVDISNTDLPMLAQVNTQNPIAKTRVFDLDFREVEEVIDRIIKDNLR